MNKLRNWTDIRACFCVLLTIGALSLSHSARAQGSNLLTTIFSEDFEGLTLGPNVNEAVAGDEVWTKTGPDGWAIDDSGVPGVGDDATDGVTEWAGWSFASKDWWVEAAGDQGRSEFTAGTGTVAVADGDEWDDQPHAEGNQTTYLSTPEIEIGEAVPGSLRIAFDSTYAADGDQESATVEVSYDGGDWEQILLWTKANTPNEKNYDSVSIAANNPRGAQTARFRIGYINVGNNWWFALDNIKVQVIRPTILFSEDFESVVLGPNVNESVAGDEVWSKTGPEGWTIDDTGVPGVGDDATDGVTEWAGWSFASKDWWVEAAGDQGRSDFTAGTGTVAVADGDEWDDQPHAEGNQTTYLSTPEIPLGNILPGSLTIAFDSSYAADGDQESATVEVSYDGGDWQQILLWTKANTPNEKNYESVAVSAGNPSGASTAKFRIGYINVGNNWWFALDNIEVTGINPFWTEDFESVVLGPNVNEAVAGDEVWSKTGPEGWTIDDTGVPGVGDDATDGVTEWAGWSFASKDWWVEAAGDQGRSEFTAGSGTVAVADGDEWDDQPHDAGNQTTYLLSPQIDISALGTPALALTADTTYAADGDQESANFEISFDGGQTWDEILLWTKANTPAEKNYESILLTSAIPAGAQTVQLKIGYINVGNNWWFAIDNLALYGLNLVQPSVVETSPRQDATNVDPGTSVSFVIDPGTEGVVDGSVKLANAAGDDLEVVVETNEDGDVIVTHTPAASFDIGENVVLTLTYDSPSEAGLSHTLSFQIADADIVLTAADQLEISKNNPGFLILTKVYGQSLANTHQRAEDQLAGRIFNEFGDPIDNFANTDNADDFLEEGGETYLIVEGVINFNQDSTPGAPASIGEVGGDLPIPGVPQGTNDGIAMQILTYLELEPGFYQMGFNSDDGFKVTYGVTPGAANAPIAGEFQGGRGAATTRFNFLVQEAGLYPFRAIWYEGNGGANLEWWTIAPDGSRVLINDRSNPNAVKAYRPTTARSPLPFVEQTSPGNNAANVAANATVTFSVVDGAIQPIDRDSVVIKVNGQEVEATITENPDVDGSLLISWTPSQLIAPGAEVAVTLEYNAGTGENARSFFSGIMYTGSDYPTLTSANSIPEDAVDTSETGFGYRIHEIASQDFEEVITLANTIGRAEAQLAGMLPYPNLAWTDFGDGTPELDSIPYVDLEDPTSVFSEGFFQGEELESILLPGLAVASLLDVPSVAVELTGFIKLPAGYTRFGINHASGARIYVGSNPFSVFDAVTWVDALPTNSYVETQFDTLVEEEGYYPIRIVLYQGGDGGVVPIGLEFYSFDTNGQRVLINDPNTPDSVKVYLDGTIDSPGFIEAVAPNPSDSAFISEQVGILLNPGSGTIANSSIKITLNGQAVTNFQTSNLDGRTLVTFSVAGFRLPQEIHGIIVQFNDGTEDITKRWVFRGLQSGEQGDATAIFSENFDSAELMPNLDETVENEEAWTRMFDGWTVDATGVPGFASEDADGDGFGDNDGVTEWAGWTFANIEFWQAVDGQRRSDFTNASGVVLVADPDEWDDAAHDDSAANGWFQTEVNSPEIAVDGRDANSLLLSFDSSWRPECDSNYRQSARIWVQYDGGEKQQVLLWTSCPGPFFKNDNSTNERITIPIANPEGSSKLVVYFEMFDAGNDWWWAVDNVEVLAAGTLFLDECAAYTAAGLPCPGDGGGDEPGAIAASINGANITITWENEGTFMIQKRTAFGPGTAWEDVQSVTGTAYSEAAEGDNAFYRVIGQ